MNKETWTLVLAGYATADNERIDRADEVLQDYVGLNDIDNHFGVDFRDECSFHCNWKLSSWNLMQELSTYTCSERVKTEIQKVLWCRLFILECLYCYDEEMGDVCIPNELYRIKEGFSPDDFRNEHHCWHHKTKVWYRNPIGYEYADLVKAYELEAKGER